MHIDGQCHCGHVTYKAEIDPENVGICHCTDCQRLSGSPFRVTVSAPRDKLQFTGNPPQSYTKHGDNGRIRYQFFCSKCGSQLLTTGDGEDAGVWGIRWGSINQRDKLVPNHQIWRRSAVHWLDSISGLPGPDTE
ncbi:GFA family protein [Allorhizobium taibaishanense]|uniref:Aldehyde-activating protein n=1 Tax=Allorhizobium taibaishanense TaxID=887144 RepID=A0A1Q9A8L8_9HYPH|nr:GFA family protein [Allorhizobium taibaishanense]MBB4009534.1 hypothetical protein [Allorhizobium taibaishanense]OLP50934.1 aldehyde-activating protein [Allorhizobium taibaishanense]